MSSPPCLMPTVSALGRIVQRQTRLKWSNSHSRCRPRTRGRSLAVRGWLRQVELSGRVERHPSEGPGVEEPANAVGQLLAISHDEEEHLPDDRGPRHGDGELDQALPEACDLAL